MNSSHFLPCQVILALEVLLGNLDVAHGHSNVTVAENLLQGGKADAGTEHYSGKSMSQLVRSNGRATRSLCRIFKCFMYPGVRHDLSVGEQEKRGSFGIGRIRWSRSCQGKDAVEDFACVIVHGHPTFVMELSEWDMERPLVCAQMTQRVPVQAEAFADPHARSTNQKECIGEEVIGLA